MTAKLLEGQVLNISNDWPLRRHINSCLIAINPQEFISVSDNGQIYKYNVSTNRWTKVVDSPSRRIKRSMNIAFRFDEEENVLYYLNNDIGLFSVDLETGTRQYHGAMNLRVDNFESPSLGYASDHGYSMDGPLLWIGDEIHTIGWNPYGQGIHAVFDTKSWNLVKDPVALMDCKMRGKSRNGSITGPLVFPQRGGFDLAESRNSLLLVGRHRASPVRIHEYSSSGGSWNTLEFHDPYGFFNQISSLTSSNDGRYILSIEGMNQIRVFDTQTMEHWKRQVEMDRDSCGFYGGRGRSIILPDEKRALCVAIGFVNQSYANSWFQHLRKLPRCLIELIAKWFVMEYLYTVFSQRTGNTVAVCRISIDEILGSE